MCLCSSGVVVWDGRRGDGRVESVRDRERKKRDGKGALPALFSTIRCLKATSRVDIPSLFEYQLFYIYRIDERSIQRCGQEGTASLN